MTGQISLNDLPLENKFNIFSRLPVESVLDCRRVCQPWKKLLQFHNDTYFADLHLRNHLGLIPIDCAPDDTSHDGSEFSNMSLMVFDGEKVCYAESHGLGDYVFYETKRTDLKFPLDVSGFVGSCNGLICLSGNMEYDSIWYHEEPNEPLYIWNPITREIVALPPIANKNLVSLVHGFGYHPLTRKYKVVRISYRSKSDDAFPYKGKVEVYTVGSGSGWRNVLKIDYLIEPSGENMNNCVNGALHWLKYETGEIVAFDLEAEEFHLVHTPPGLSPDSNKALSSRVFVMRGCLCLAYEYEFYGDLWMLKKQENAVTSDFYNAKDQYYKSRKWIKEIEIPYEDLNHALKIFGLTKEGSVILKHDDGSMTQYHPKFTARVGDSACIQLISHINSFVSLKALGEVNVVTYKGEVKVDTPIGSTKKSDGGRRKRKKKRKRTREV